MIRSLVIIGFTAVAVGLAAFYLITRRIDKNLDEKLEDLKNQKEEQ